jgi:hypothetical protein
MTEERIRHRCPDPRFVIVARYLSTRFIVNDEGVATLVPRRDFVVRGPAFTTGTDSFACDPAYKPIHSQYMALNVRALRI